LRSIRLRAYDVPLNAICQAYGDRILGWPAMQEWIEQAHMEKVQFDELEVEF